jgi:hypothetical protein
MASASQLFCCLSAFPFLPPNIHSTPLPSTSLSVLIFRHPNSIALLLEQDDNRVAAPDEVHPIARAVVDPAYPTRRCPPASRHRDCRARVARMSRRSRKCVTDGDIRGAVPHVAALMRATRLGAHPGRSHPFEQQCGTSLAAHRCLPSTFRENT